MELRQIPDSVTGHISRTLLGAELGRGLFYVAASVRIKEAPATALYDTRLSSCRARVGLG